VAPARGVTSRGPVVGRGRRCLRRGRRRARQLVGVLDAGLAPERRVRRGDAAHADAFDEADGRLVACVDDREDAARAGPLEDECTGFGHGFGREPLTLRRPPEREADLGLAAVLRDADADVADQPVVLAPRDRELRPGAALQQLDPVHLLEECAGRVVALRRPALVAADRGVVPVGLERGEVVGAQPAQHDPLTFARQCLLDSMRHDPGLTSAS
jgi:hypothetical protein